METYEVLGLFIFLVVQVSLTFWYVQLMHLLDRTGGSFPGKYHKIMWMCLLAVLNLLGAAAYWIYVRMSQSRLPEARISR